jgi:5-methylthioribose kinase
MCLISEKLVFTEPYTNHYGTNVLFEDNTAFFEKELYNDAELCMEAAKLYEKFKTCAQALIHGDLHTGSIFVKTGSTMVLDSEFAFFGPIGYDAGNVIANLIFAWVNAFVTIPGQTERKGFLDRLETTISDTADLFYAKSLKILKEHTADKMAQTPGYAEWYMQNVMHDTMGYAGLELNRRVIGDAKVADIAGIKNRGSRKIAEQICVLCAKKFMLERSPLPLGRDYIEVLHTICQSYSPVSLFL